MASASILYEVFLFALSIRFISSQVEEGSPCIEKQLNVTGRCVLVDNCNSARRDLLNNTVPTPCSLTDNSVVVCCRDGTPAENANLPKPPDDRVFIFGLIFGYYANNFKRIRVSERKCFEMLKEVNKKAKELLESTDDINIVGGIATCAGVGFVIGGTPAYPNEFPHMAAIGWTTPEGEYKYKCGGSLISTKFVMTAAHCTYDPNVVNHEPDIVHLGDHNINPAYKDDANPIDVRIKTIHKHPDYRPPLRYNDIALLELEETLRFNINIRPACLWARDELLKNTYYKATATGWGVTETGKTADVLQTVSLSILDNKPCDFLLASARNRNWWGFTPSQLCAGELAGGKDTCQGDSGGPLMVTGEHCMYHVIGVTSFGQKCGQVNRPAIYTRVSSYLDWIESIVWPGE